MRLVDPAGNGLITSLGYVWDPVLLDYVVATQAAAGGGIAAAVTIIDGGDIAQGAKADLESAAGNGSVIALLKRLRTLLSSTEGTVVVTSTGVPVLFKDDAFPNTLRIPSNANPLPVAIGGLQVMTIKGNAGGFVNVVGTSMSTDPVDRAARALGVVASITAAVDVGDRAARVLGKAQLLDSASALIDPALKGQLPAALGATGGLKVEGIAGGIAQPVSLAAAVDVSDRVARVLGVVSIADGGDVVQGAKADAVWDGVTVSTTFGAVFKYIGQKIEAVRVLLAGTLRSAKREIGYANLAMYAEAVAGIIAETAISINLSRAFGAAAAATSNGAAAAKELVITGMIVSWVSTAATANTCRVRIRVNPAGAAIITSPIALTFRISWESATFIANEGELRTIVFAEPIIVPNPGQFMATLACAAANGTLDIQLLGYERTP